mmetsp:Transcript_4987/g.16255  ORF Transcript_4987/g.16255 Transcript_4987/m.16255 type:complete len:244 (-) Transcript_4987:216-947(-)
MAQALAMLQRQAEAGAAAGPASASGELPGSLGFSSLVCSLLDARLQATLEGLPPFGARECLVSGPPHSGKTSILFSAAFAAASRGERALVIASRRKLEETPPLIPKGCLPSNDAFKRVDIKYADSCEDLQRYLAGFALLDSMPHIILVDDLGGLVDGTHPQGKRNQDGSMLLAKLLALLADAAGHATARLAREEGTSACCRLVVTDTSDREGAPRQVFLYRRWLPAIVSISGGCRIRLQLALG